MSTIRCHFSNIAWPVSILLVCCAGAAGALGACGTPSGVVDVSRVVPYLPRSRSIPLDSNPLLRESAATDAPDAPAEPDPWADRTDLITPPEPPPLTPLALPEIDRFNLPNGLPVMVVRDARVPVVDVRLMVKAGSMTVAREQAGLARITAAMLTRGTRTRDAAKIAQTIEQVGGRLGANAGNDATLLSCKVVGEHQRTCLDLIADIAVNASFPESELGAARGLVDSATLQLLTSAGDLADAHLRNLVWGGDHPRGWGLDREAISRITRADVVDWHRSWFKPQNAVLVIAGDVNTRGLKFRLSQTFRGWARGKVPERASYEPRQPTELTVRLVDRPDLAEAHIRLGHLGVAYSDADFFDSLVFNQALGGAGASRMSALARARAGALYAASSRFEFDGERGMFAVSAVARAADAVGTVKLLLDEMVRMEQAGVSDPEVRAAAIQLAGRYAGRFQTSGRVADVLVNATLHGLSDEFVRSYPVALGQVTAATASRAASTRLKPGAISLVLVGNARTLEPQLKAASVPYTKVDYRSPVGASAAAEAPSQAAAELPAQSAKEGRALLAKAVAAKGGAGKLKTIKSLKVEAVGTIRSGGQELAANITRQLLWPDKLRLDLDLTIPGGAAQIITVLSGEAAYSKQPGGVVELPADARAELRKQIWRDPELLLRRAGEDGVKVEGASGVRVDGADYNLVTITDPDGAAVQIFLDPKSHLVRRVAYSDSGAATVETFDDYRAVAGVQIAHRRKTTSADTDLDITIQKVTINPKLPASLFERPAD